MKSFLPLLVATVLLSGCYQTSIVMDNEPSDHVEYVRVDKFLNGLFPRLPSDSEPSTAPISPQSSIEVDDLCDGAPAHKVETYQSFWNGLLAGITAGIYTPITVRVTCAR